MARKVSGDEIPPVLIPVAPTHGSHADPDARAKRAFLDVVGVRRGDKDSAWQKSWGATMQRNPTYSGKPSSQRGALRDRARDLITTIAGDYTAPLSEKTHENNIERVAKTLSDEFSPILSGGRFKIGSAQKALNLYLKYLWCFGDIPEPPHCPLDAVVQSKAKVSNPVRWTAVDSIGDYRRAISNLRQAALNGEPDSVTLAQWELRHGWSR